MSYMRVTSRPFLIEIGKGVLMYLFDKVCVVFGWHSSLKFVLYWQIVLGFYNMWRQSKLLVHGNQQNQILGRR